MIATFHHGEFGDAGVLERWKRGRLISVCIPTLNEEDTVGDVVRVLREELVEKSGLVDELAVMDSGSTDRTREVAAAAGARVVLASEVMPWVGPACGKGENIWKAVAALRGDILCFVDGDVRNMHPRFVMGTVGPLLAEDRLMYVKGYYDRPHAVAEVGQRPAGGGRVTEALVRPLFALFYPELTGLVQPLAGEYAARRDVLESLPMPTGYGVETAHLIDVLEKFGAGAIGQTDLDERQHRHQDTASLGRMSFAILHAFFTRAHRSGRLQVPGDLPTAYRHFLRDEGVCKEFSWELPDIERPPLREVRGLVQSQVP
ncbi:MAG: glucosyl-3-phosphoglycerate synthase [Terrimicrobiaceae bacterium]